MYVRVYNTTTGLYDTILSKGSGLLSATGGWRQVTVDLTAYAGQYVRLEFEFRTEDALNNNYEGWLVDDITVWAVSNPVGVEAFRSLTHTSDLDYTPSRMDYVADHDTFVFNEEQSGGSFTISTNNLGSAVNGALAVYDYATGEMLYPDGDSGTGTEASVVLPNSGYWNSYMVEVWDTEEDTTGDLDVRIDGTSTLAPSTIVLDGYGDATVNNVLDVTTDTDYFTVTAPADTSGTVDFTVAGTSGDVLPRLQIWRADGDDAPEIASTGYPSAGHLTGVTPGEVFQIAIADNDFRNAGNYSLAVNFATSLPPTMTTAEGFAYFHHDGISHDTQTYSTYVYEAYIMPADDIDSFYFAGDYTGTYTITSSGAVVDPVIAVYDATTGARLGFDDDSGGGTTAALSLSLTAYHRYIVAVGDATVTNQGDVSIVITQPSTCGVSAIAVDANGDGSGTTYLGTGDGDYFSFVSPADTNGTLTITLDPDDTLNVAGVLFDATGHEIAKAYLNGTGANETITVSGLNPSTTYYLSVLSVDYATSGNVTASVNFDLIVPDQFPGTYDYWTMPSGVGDWSAGFFVDSASDWDGWKP